MTSKKLIEFDQFYIEFFYQFCFILTFTNLKESTFFVQLYISFDMEKVENIISYIASKVKNLTITSLNKYLWFIDVLSFNQRSIAITGLTYQNQKFGPTIIDKKYDELS